MSARADTSGWAAMSSCHHVVPAFWTPMPTKSGGPQTSPAARAGGVKSNPASHGAYRPRACRTASRTEGGSLENACFAVVRALLARFVTELLAATLQASLEV